MCKKEIHSKGFSVISSRFYQLNLNFFIFRSTVWFFFCVLTEARGGKGRQRGRYVTISVGRGATWSLIDHCWLVLTPQTLVRWINIPSRRGSSGYLRFVRPRQVPPIRYRGTCSIKKRAREIATFTDHVFSSRLPLLPLHHLHVSGIRDASL